jgi:hypothetical protein
MSNTRLTLAPFAAILLLSLSAPLHAADLPGAASQAELGSRYSQALAQKDSTAYSLLVCWDGVLPMDRRQSELGFAQQASNTATDFRFLTRDQMDQEVVKSGGSPLTRGPVKRAGVALDFNLPVMGYFVYHFKSQDGKSQGDGAVPFGMKGGRYFVTTRAPVQ